MAVRVITQFQGNLVTGTLAPALTDSERLKWESHTQNAAEEIIAGRESKISDASQYVSKVAETSAVRWNQSVNPAYIGKSGKTASVIIATRAAKMATSFQKWLDGMNNAFATEGGVVAKNFKDAVKAKSASWAQNQAAFVLPFTGTGKHNKGPIVFIQDFLTGSLTYTQTIPSTWTSDAAVNIIKPGMESSFKPMVTGMLLQMMNFAAVTGFDPSVLAAANAKIVTAFNALLNTAVANEFAAPDASPNSSLILSAGPGEGVLHVECIIRFST